MGKFMAEVRVARRQIAALAMASSSDMMSPAWRSYLPAALLLFAGIGGLAIAGLPDRDDSGRYLVIASPGTATSHMIGIVKAADGRLVQAGRFSNIAIAWSDRPDFADRTRQSGAWLAIAAPDGAGCYGSSANETL